MLHFVVFSFVVRSHCWLISVIKRNMFVNMDVHRLIECEAEEAVFERLR